MVDKDSLKSVQKYPFWKRMIHSSEEYKLGDKKEDT